MKTLKISCLITTFLSTVIACTAADKILTSSEALCEISVVQNNNKFALELYGNLKAQQGNLFLSPYSISTALAMAYAGASGETEIQIAKTLNFYLYSDSNDTTEILYKPLFHKTFGDIIHGLNEAGEKGNYELAVANALWGQKGYVFLKEFLALVKTNYDGNLEQVDFARQTEAARNTINDWVENKTKDKIKELIKPGMLDTMTRLVLTNAIYFKGKWASEFKPERTQDAPFTLSGGEKIDVPMMNRTGQFGYMETDAMQVLELPYISDELSMVIFLPKQLEGIGEVEDELTSDNLSDRLTKLRKREVEVWLPKFKMTSEFELAEVLAKMGMPDAFSGKADFSGMTGSRDFFISAVIHKAYVDVNEEGTEAAAATAVTMKLTSVGPKTPVFKADHPFVFLIRDNITGSILFIGRVADPRSN